MDVAAFVGFASSGPIDLPVSVYDQVRFEEIFGDDVLLAHRENGEPVYGHLAATVRAFFRNGGRKCYVVRVASDDAASSSFLVPGLMAIADRGPSIETAGWGSTLLWARSEGPWADGLRVGAVLRKEPYVTSGVRLTSLGIELSIAGAGTTIPQAGDLVQVDHQDPAIDGAFSRSTRLYLFVESIARSDASEGLIHTGAKARIAGSEHWFEVVAGSGAHVDPLKVKARLMSPRSEDGGAVGSHPGDGEQPARWFLPEEAGALHRVVLPFDAGASAGALIELHRGSEDPEDPSSERLLAGVTEVRDPTQEELEAVRGVDIDRWRTALVREVLAPLDPAEGRARFQLAPFERLRADRLTFDLWTRDERGITNELRRLGFAPQSPRYVGHLPTDRMLYGTERSSAPTADGPHPGLSLWNEADHPRFPLAARCGSLEASGPTLGQSVRFLPIGMEHSRRIEATSGRYLAAGTASLRAGLHRFSADLFLDPDLASIPAETLADTAFHKQYVQGRPLRRLHAVMPREDVTLLSVPDAVHPHWNEVVPIPTPVLEPPNLDPISASDIKASTHWSAVEPVGAGPVQYLLEEAFDPQFTVIVQRRRLDETEAEFEVDAVCQKVRYYRVRAEERDEVGPWSNTQVALLPSRPFEECGLVLPPPPIPAAPVLNGPEALSDGRYGLSWSPVDPPSQSMNDPAPGSSGIVYVVEQGERPDFLDAQVLYRGSDTKAQVFVQVGAAGDEGVRGPLYFRVRAHADGIAGAWSNTVVLLRPVGTAGRLVAEEIADGNDAAKVHTAMLSACAARGDMTCVMAIPAGYDDVRAAAYAARLGAGFGRGRDRALGYGALYHPWTWVAHADRSTRLIPPDGSATGVIARRTIERGAWIAPANVVLQDVVALEFDLAEDGLERLYGAGANVIARDTRGFVLLGADTLSRDAAMRPISVRRLLILIRKLALREGQDMVFAPNDAALRRRVRRRFESILSQLFVRGALAGSTPDEGFRVVTDDHARLDADLGRLIVELRVAPSRPLEFIKVRLVQTERDGGRLVESI